jgi:hypothetical protein
MSNDTKHTTGPWSSEFIHIQGKPDMSWDVMDSDYDSVISENGYMTKANAHLIAAAPDMIEALENLENDANSIPDHAWKLVQDAISKAKGESE